MNKLQVLYEDNHIIAVLKPANMLSQADNTKDLDLLTLTKQYIKEKYHKPGNVYLGLVHRLDRPVSGIMVFARTTKAASRLSEEIRTHSFKKTYLAIVRGILPTKSGILEDYLKKLENGNTIVTNKDNGKLARLTYEVINEDKTNQLSLVKINLETGRHHQIRVQFASRKYPLCGDQRYGRQDNTPIALHAYKVEFKHPVKDEIIKLESLPANTGYWTNFTL